MGNLKLSKNTKLLLLPAFSILVLTALSYLVFKFGYSKFVLYKKNLEELKKIENVLRQKESLLRVVDSNVAGYSDISLNVLPDRNSSLMVISTLKANAAKSGLILESLKIGSSSSESDLSQVGINFETNAEVSKVFELLKSLKATSPIMILNSLKFDNPKAIPRASIGLSSYWSLPPKKIPAITEPILDLSNEESETLVKISEIQVSQFSNLSPSGGDLSRESPF